MILWVINLRNEFSRKQKKKKDKATRQRDRDGEATRGRELLLV